MQLAEQRFRLQRHRMRDEPRLRRKPWPERIEHRAIEPAADEHRIRRFQIGEGFGRPRCDDTDPVCQSERGDIRADIRGAILACLDRSRRSTAQRPLDRDRTRAGADISQPFAGTRRQRRKRERAYRPLGDLTVMGEEFI